MCIKNDKNIVLIGMSAVGKTKVGKLLAEQMNLSYIDEDDYFEEQNGLIHVVRNELSDEDYKNKERLVRKHIKGLSNHIISAGGQFGMSDEIDDVNGIKIQLKPSTNDILKKYKKLSEDKTSASNLRRKLVFKSPSEIKKQIKIRNKKFKSKANIILDTTGLRKEEIAKLVIKTLIQIGYVKKD
jgi:shikimate kinase